jgi:hypothetical protein
VESALTRSCAITRAELTLAQNKGGVGDNSKSETHRA